MVVDRVDWLRDDLKYIRRTIDDIRISQTAHENTCPARRAYNKKPSVPPSPYLSPMKILFRLAPLIMAAAMGLLGIGAYFGNNTSDKLEQEMAVMKKVLNEVKRVDNVTSPN